MANKREDHLARREALAQRQLEDGTRRWPGNPKIIVALLVVALLLILILSL